MGELASWAQIGFGNIGQEVGAQIRANAERLGLREMPEHIERRTGFYEPDGTTRLPETSDVELVTPNLAIVALPTTPNGILEFSRISRLLQDGAAVITAGKGALANHYAEIQALSDGGRRFGGTAAVGGGTGMVPELKQYFDRYDLNEAHLAVNGTFAAITSSTAPFKEAVRQAVDAGFAEPGSASPHDVIRAETDDIALKTGILFNMLGLGGNKIMDWQRLRFALTDEQVEQAMDGNHRFFVSFYPQTLDTATSPRISKDIIGGFDVEHNGWQLVAGFSEIGRNAVRAALETTSGPDIGFAVGLGPENSHGVYSLVGPGAGPGPTASTMLGDWLRIRQTLSSSTAG